MVIDMQKIFQGYDIHYGLNSAYCTPKKQLSFFEKHFPSVAFYTRAFRGPIRKLCFSAKVGKCDSRMWSNCSVGIGKLMESVGATIDINGMQHVDSVQGPCIFIGNHMSTLETFMLPGILRPRGPVTFVVKDSLMKMPFFGAVLATRSVIAVGRANPRDDLKLVLDEGKKLLDKGMSLIIFPQSTRSVDFDPQKFNSIGVKLAVKSGKPVVPLALKTDAWAQGSLVKDFGAVHPQRPIHYAFGAPLQVQGKGKEEHAYITQFIIEHLARWEREDAM